MPTSINFTEMEKLAESMAKVPKKVVPIMKHTVYEGAGVLKAAVLKSLNEKMLGHGDPRNTKHLADDLITDKIDSTADSASTNLHFADYDTVITNSHPKGKPQPLKAAVLESGRAEYYRTEKSGRVVRVPPVKATHFYSMALSANRSNVKSTMEKEFNEWITNAIEGE